MTGQRAKNFAEGLAVFEWKRITKAVSKPKSKKTLESAYKRWDWNLSFGTSGRPWTRNDLKSYRALPFGAFGRPWNRNDSNATKNFTFGASGQRLARNWPRYYQSWSCEASGWPWARNDSRWHQNRPFVRAEGALHVQTPKNNGRAEGPLHDVQKAPCTVWDRKINILGSYFDISLKLRQN